MPMDDGVLIEALALLQRAGLEAPPIPAEFVGRLRKVATWCYATRPTAPMAMYFFDSHIEEALLGKTDDYVAFSHAGHGANSYAVTYELVYGGLVLLTQVAWGGIYMDSTQARQDVNEMFGRCRELVGAYQALNRAPANPRRLVVIESRMRMIEACGWLSGVPSKVQAQTWVQENRTTTVRELPIVEQLPTTRALTLIKIEPRQQGPAKEKSPERSGD